MAALLGLLLTHTPIPFPAPTPERAARLNGTEVVVRFEISTPPLAYDDITAVGPDDQGDDVERNVYLKGKRYDIDVGDAITVRGTLRVIRHNAATVSGSSSSPAATCRGGRSWREPRHSAGRAVRLGILLGEGRAPGQQERCLHEWIPKPRPASC
jgi:hypothetical protein